MNDFRANIEQEIAVMHEETQRVKTVLNTHGLDVTTAAYVIMIRYRMELKAHIKKLYDCLEELDEGDDYPYG